ncbi:MAG: VanW family protein [Treponema sp.]|nr:VanW family protein [Treponema sp.]
MNDILQKEILRYIDQYVNPKRVAVSKKFPFLKSTIIFLRCLKRSIQNNMDLKLKIHKEKSFFENTIASHQTVLRKLSNNLKSMNDNSGNLDFRLQENKILNMKKAAEKLNGIIIKPGKTFSFWHTIGNPSAKNGYAEGRIYLKGKIASGIGGGLCQLSSFLYWLFLHTPVKILERHPHSLDAFPDSKQNVFSRCTATVLYNFMDLKIRNDFEYPIQLKIWFTDDHINGQIMSVNNTLQEYNILEKNHYFIKTKNRVFQYNEIYREVKKNSEIIKIEKITANFLQILYDLKDEYIKENSFEVLDFNNV